MNNPRKTHLRVMQKADQMRKIGVILKGNFRAYLSANEDEVRGSIDHDLTFSDADTVDFQIARKNQAGAWMNTQNAVTEIMDGEMFEDGDSTPAEEFLKQLEEKFAEKKEVLLAKHRAWNEESIKISFSQLNRVKNNFIAQKDPAVAIYSIKNKTQEQLKKGFKDSITFLTEEVPMLLTESETVDLQNLSGFYTALEDAPKSKESAAALAAYF